MYRHLILFIFPCNIQGGNIRGNSYDLLGNQTYFYCEYITYKIQEFSLQFNMKAEDVSDVHLDETANFKNIEKRTGEFEFQFDPIDELGLMVDKNDPEDKKELQMILFGILDYPSEKLAEFHSEAMRLGNFDLQDNSKKTHEKAQLKTMSKMAEEAKVCPCCGFKRQTEPVPVCASIDSISNIGTSTYLYFSTFKNLSILLFIMTIVYSIYSLATNIIAAKNNSMGSTYTVDYLTISLSSKQSNNTDTNKRFYFIQAWLGMATVVIWIFIFIYNRYQEIKGSQEYDDASKSASDYSIAIQGVPMDVTQEEIRKSFKSYYNILSRKAIPASQKRELNVQKISVGKPFFMSQDQLKDKELEDIIKEIQEQKEIIRKWVLERQDLPKFKETKEKREETYKKLGQLEKKKAEKSAELAKNLQTKLKEQKSDDLTTVFVSFDTNIARNLVLTFNGLSLFSQLKAICGDQSRYALERGDRAFIPKIERAPEPEDIIWPNIGRSDCNTRLRKFFIYFITAILLGICFIIVYYLSLAQQDAGNNRTISIAISIVIAGVNLTLGVVISFLTQFQKDYTSTNRQASLAIKSIIAQMINSILTPVITAYYIKKDSGVYKTGGLVDNIFMMSLTNSLLPSVVLFFHPFNVWVWIQKKFKSRRSGKLYLTQKELNMIYEGTEFEVGAEYIYIVNLFMFVCFFVSLQPIVSVIALLGYFLMYWVEKYCLFNREKRPVPGTDFVNKAVYQVVFLGPLMYSLGSLTWSNFDPNGIPPEAIIPNLIAVLFSVLLIILPINTLIVGCCIKEDTSVKVTTYDSDRMFFSSQYDRVNPSTRIEGVEDFKKFMQKKQVEISKMSKEEQEAIAIKQAAQAQRAILTQAAQVSRPAFGGFGGFGGSPYGNYYQPQPQPFYGYAAQPYNMYSPAPMFQPQPMQMHPAQMQMPMPMQQMQMPMQQPAFNPFGFGYQQPAYNPNPYANVGFGGGYNPNPYGGYGYGGYGGYR